MKTLALMLILSSACWAQDTPRFSKSLKLLIGMQLASAGADAYFTNRGMHLGAIEHDPIARPFVGKPSGVVLFFSASAGIHIAGACLLHKHHHTKWAAALLVEGTGNNTYGAAYSASHYQALPTAPPTVTPNCPTWGCVHLPK